jgi:hypothetical protein
MIYRGVNDARLDDTVEGAREDAVRSLITEILLFRLLTSFGKSFMV